MSSTPFSPAIIPPFAVSIYAGISAERDRQEQLKEQGRFLHTLSDDALTDADRFVIVGEEFGEVARAIQTRDDENLTEEVRQIAALCVAWLENLKKRGFH